MAQKNSDQPKSIESLQQGRGSRSSIARLNKDLLQNEDVESMDNYLQRKRSEEMSQIQYQFNVHAKSNPAEIFKHRTKQPPHIGNNFRTIEEMMPEREISRSKIREVSVNHERKNQRIINIDVTMVGKSSDRKQGQQEINRLRNGMNNDRERECIHEQEEQEGSLAQRLNEQAKAGQKADEERVTSFSMKVRELNNENDGILRSRSNAIP